MHYLFMVDKEQALLNNDGQKIVEADNALTEIISDCRQCKQANPFLTDYYTEMDINKALRCGVRNFKIEGRTVHISTLMRDISKWLFTDDSILGLYTAYCYDEV